jgi:hypothetical protein
VKFAPIERLQANCVPAASAKGQRSRAREHIFRRVANVPNGGKVWHIVGRPNRTRIRAWFKTKEAAQAEATERNLAMRKLGENAVALDAVLAETARDGATRLKPYGKTLKDAIDFYLSHLIALQSSISARELESRIVARFAMPWLSAASSIPIRAKSPRQKRPESIGLC